MRAVKKAQRIRTIKIKCYLHKKMYIYQTHKQELFKCAKKINKTST